MIHRIVSVALAFIFVSPLFSQDREAYADWVKKGEKHYQNEEFRASAEAYRQAFQALGDKGFLNDRYNAACSWALAGEKDSAFVQLFRIARTTQYTSYQHLTSDPDLKSLHDDERWEAVTMIVKDNKTQAEAHLDQALVARLDSIFQEDQQYRMQLDPVEKEHGRNSEEMRQLWKTILEKDSLNLLKVRQILDDRGWPGPDVIGQQGSMTLFLVIQHADLETQETYLPLMREAVAQGKASAANLALLEDRVALRQGKRQIYGSQIGYNPESQQYYVLPLNDPLLVDERRSKVGLGPLADYVSRWGMEWDPQKYLEQLPELEKAGQ